MDDCQKEFETWFDKNRFLFAIKVEQWDIWQAAWNHSNRYKHPDVISRKDVYEAWHTPLVADGVCDNVRKYGHAIEGHMDVPKVYSNIDTIAKDKIGSGDAKVNIVHSTQNSLPPKTQTFISPVKSSKT